jgi:hypothetical protein
MLTSTMAELGYAQDVNSNLLSPSKIKWYNNVDNVDTILATNHLTPASLAKPTTLDHFFPSGNPTTEGTDKIAGGSH